MGGGVGGGKVRAERDEGWSGWGDVGGESFDTAKVGTGGTLVVDFVFDGRVGGGGV